MRARIEVAKEKFAGMEKAEGEVKLTQYMAGNSQLLVDYRDALINAYRLGESIKEIYGIVPPRCIVESCGVNMEDLIISLNVS